MKDGKRKLNSFLVVTMFVLSALAVMAIVPTAIGDETLTGTGISADQITAIWNDNWMEDAPLVADVDEPIVLNCDYWIGFDSMYYLGDDDRDVRITFENGNDPLDDVTATLTALTATPSNPINVDIQTDTWAGVGAWAANTQYEAQFTVDIANSGEVERTYPMRVQITYTFGGNPETQTLDFEIWLSSVWERDTNDAERDVHDGLPNLEEQAPDDAPFESGDMFQDGAMYLTDHANDFDPEEVWGNITSEPTDIDISQGTTNAYDPGTWGGVLNYRVDVPSNTVSAGFKSGGMIQFEYTRSDNFKRITENARSFGAYVDFTPLVTASLVTAVQINQNDLTATMSVVFTNNGNVDLLDLTVSPDLDGDWLDARFHHYENDDDVYVTEVNLGSLGAGDPSAAQDVVIATDIMLPNGTHRVPFRWSAWYYEDGTTGSASRWVMVGGYMFDDGGGTRTQEVGRVYEDVDEDGVWDMGEPIHLEGLDAGAYVDFDVIDGNGLTWEAFLWNPTTINAGVGGDVTYTTITIRIYNNEMVDYKDLEVVLDVGAGTPFFDPANHGAGTLEMDPTSDTYIPAASILGPGTADIDFTVDVNAAWWQTNAFEPGAYLVDITVDATNNDDETRIVGSTVPVKLAIDGFGPEIFATMVIYEDITPGDNFTLTIRLYNYGDDIAREVDAYLRTDIVSGWTILDQFTTSIGGYAGEGDNPPVGDASWGWITDWSTYTRFNRSHDIRPGEIGIESVEEIVEYHDWISRRETPPQGVVLWMHLDRLDADQVWEVSFNMISDVNMVEGMAYYKTLDLYYVDSNGNQYGPDEPDPYYSPPQQVLIRSGKGEKFTGEDEFDYSVVLYAIIFLIIAFIVFIIGFALGGRGRGPEPRMEEPPYEPYEEEYEPPPGPGPAPEEDIGPPLPEEPKPPE